MNVSEPRSMSREEKLELARRLLREKERAAGSFPLSFAQEPMWFLDRLEPGNPVNNIFRALSWRGPLDRAVLAEALGELVRRHEALRTCFPAEEGAPRQQIGLSRPFELEVEDLGPLAPAERLPRAAALAAAEARRGFDLARGPVFRARLLRLAESEHVLLLGVHHIAADGWSLGLLLTELAALYRAFAAAEPSPLPEPPLQPADFAVWQRERLRGARREEELAFWRGRLAGFPAVLELPTDHPRPAAASFRGAMVPFTVPPEQAEALRRLSRGAGATLFMTLCAAFEALLARHVEQDAFLLGTQVAGRNRPELERMVGFCAETLVLRARVDRGAPFGELLDRVRREVLEALAHQELPFELLVEDLRPERHAARNPLFQVSFAFLNLPGAVLAVPGVELGTLEVERGLSKLDLTVEMTERDGGLAGSVELSTDLFEPATAAALAERFSRLLAGIAADPERRIDELPLLTPAEERLLAAAGAGPVPPAPPLPVHRAAARSARRAPGADAVLFGEERLAYGELWERARCLARHLRGLGVGPEVRVGICLERSLELPVALLAVLEAGGAYVPLDPAYPHERLAFLMADSGLRVLLTRESLAERLPAAPVTLRLDGPERPWEGGGGGEQAAEDAVFPESTACVIYTSGSTGVPKGVAVPHRALANHAAAVAARYGLGPADRVLQLASFSFDVAGEEIFPTWCAGAALVPGPPGLFPSFPELERLISAREITVANLPTHYWHEWTAELARAGTPPPAPLRLVVVGTEQASAARLAQWLALPGAGVRWINAYGPTEATVTATVHEAVPGEAPRGEAAAGQRPRVPIGSPLAGVRARVLDAFLQPVPPGVPGELCLGGAGVTRGYLRHPERTAEVFVPDPWEPGARLYRTGDRARLLPSGEIELLGRADGQVKIRGFRIEPGEIETVLRGHPEVREAVVLAREALAQEDGPGELRLLAWVVPHGGAPDPRSLLGWLRERLPGYMIPGAIMVLPALPLTPSGKVDRAALPSPDRATAGSGRPRTLMEEVLAGIWATLLQRDRVGPDESFFDLGGHSLLAVQVVSRVREAVGVELPLRVLFEAPSVAATARVVEESLRTGSVLTAPPVTPLVRTGPCACSFAQERLWVLDRLTPGSPAYNVPLALRFQGTLDTAALARALAEIVRRHEALRTSFPAVDGRPVQVIHPAAPVPLPAVDLSGLPDPGAEAERRTVAESVRPFELDRGPVLRSVLFRLAPGEHRLCVTFHHIVSDGWSLEIFLRELMEAYAACAGGGVPRLPELPVQYADFAVWQRGWLQGEALERQIRFWREALAGVPVNLELPLDQPRPPVLTVRGGRVPLVLPPPVVQGLRAVAREGRATLFMVLASTFAILLSRLSGQDDVSLGTPSASRDRREIEGLIGFFANTLVLRTIFSGQPDVAALLAQVRERLLGAYAHQDLPFERLVEELNPERVLSHNTLVEAFFVLNQGGGAPLAAPGLGVTVLPVDNHTSRFDLLVSFNEEGSHLPGFLEYYADLFDAPTAARFARCYSVLAAALAGRAGGPVASLPLLDEAERAAILRGWNDTAADYGPEEPFQALFEAQARKTPDAVALAFGATALSYRALDAAAGRLARILSGLGVGPESLVGVAMERSLEVIVALFGILKAGGAWVPLDPAYPRERLAYMLEDSGVEVLLTQERLAAVLPETSARIVFLDGAPDEGAAPVSPVSVPVLPDGAAYMIYTSGSTGRPKGAVNTHRAIRNFLLWMQGRLRLRPDDRVLQTTPFSFDVSVWEVFWPVFNGARLVMAPPGAQQDPEEVLRLLEVEGITTVHFVPSMMEVFLDSRGLSARGLSACASLRRVMSSGEALPWSLREAFFARMPAGVELHNLYGPTEAAVDVSSWECRRDDGQPIVPIGRPLANTRLYVLDRLLQPVPVGVQGELFAGGVQLARGYHRRPELTAERFVPDPVGEVPGERLYRTGDLTRNLPDGNVKFLGRLDFQVKVRGFRIELGEIETALRHVPGVREALVVARTEDGVRLVAYLVPSAPGEGAGVGLELGELRTFLLERLPEFMVPAHFVTLDALPLAPNGKVDRAALPVPDRTHTAAAGLVAPSGPVEERVAAIWAEVLRLERVGAHDNFFELGGHSLLATQVLARLEDAFGVGLPLRDLFEYPTVAGLAERIVQAELLRADAGLMERLLAGLGA